VPGTLDGLRKQALMSRADPADSPGQYLPAFGNEMTKEFPVLEIDIRDFFRAKLANSFAPYAEPFGTWHSSFAFLP
jgi:hypothetical protein